MTRRHRTLAALLAAVALLYAQLAVSAHACIAHERAAAEVMVSHHEGCDGAMDSDESPVTGNVCAGHCQYGDASFDNSSPAPAVVDSSGPVLRVEPVATGAGSHAPPAWHLEPAKSPPPPALLFGVLRI
jgi:hypothetical protein